MTIQQLFTEYQTYRYNLNVALQTADTQQITYYRGNLIRTISKIISPNYAAQVNPQYLYSLQTELQTELVNHKAQINSRLKNEKRKKTNYSISNEISLKLQRNSALISEIKTATSTIDQTAAVFKTIGNTVSTMFSISKYALKPASFVVQKAGGMAAYLTGYVVGMPLELFGKIVNPNGPINFAISRQCGGAFKDVTEAALGKVNDAIIRM